MITFICADALVWLADNHNIGSIVTSLPDAEEIGKSVKDWREWFVVASSACMAATSPECSAVFYQTDRKCGGEVFSKAQLLFEAASASGLRLLWHKIVLRREPGKVDIHRPGFTHLMAFSKEGKPGTATPDVIGRGGMLYPNAMGQNAARVALDLAIKSGADVTDPFCGRGTIPLMAHRMGMNALGIDIDAGQISIAKQGQQEMELA